jgi:hypothetical protein
MTKKPRRRPQILTPKERHSFVKEYGEATSWGGKKAVCEKYNISEGQATHLIEEYFLGDKKRTWASYTPTQQAEIMQAYVDAPEGKKREVAFSYGLMTRAISAALGRAKEKGEAPEPEYRALHPIKNPPNMRDYEKTRRAGTVSFAQGEPEVHFRQRPSRVTHTPPSASDAADELWSAFKAGHISQDTFNILLSKLNK